MSVNVASYNVASYNGAGRNAASYDVARGHAPTVTECFPFARLSGTTAFVPLHRQKPKRVKGIEPSSSAWKAIALPLSYTRMQYPSTGG